MLRKKSLFNPVNEEVRWPGLPDTTQSTENSERRVEIKNPDAEIPTNDEPKNS